MAYELFYRGSRCFPPYRRTDLINTPLWLATDLTTSSRTPSILLACPLIMGVNFRRRAMVFQTQLLMTAIIALFAKSGLCHLQIYLVFHYCPKVVGRHLSFVLALML